MWYMIFCLYLLFKNNIFMASFQPRRHMRLCPWTRLQWPGWALKQAPACAPWWQEWCWSSAHSPWRRRRGQKTEIIEMPISKPYISDVAHHLCCCSRTSSKKNSECLKEEDWITKKWLIKILLYMWKGCQNSGKVQFASRTPQEE